MPPTTYNVYGLHTTGLPGIAYCTWRERDARTVLTVLYRTVLPAAGTGPCAFPIAPSLPGGGGGHLCLWWEWGWKHGICSSSGTGQAPHSLLDNSDYMHAPTTPTLPSTITEALRSLCGHRDVRGHECSRQDASKSCQGVRHRQRRHQDTTVTGQDRAHPDGTPCAESRGCHDAQRRRGGGARHSRGWRPVQPAAARRGEL